MLRVGRCQSFDQANGEDDDGEQDGDGLQPMEEVLMLLLRLLLLDSQYRIGEQDVLLLPRIRVGREDLVKLRLPGHIGALPRIRLHHHHSVLSPHHAKVEMLLVVFIHLLAAQLQVLQASPSLHQQRTRLVLPELPQTDRREETQQLDHEGLEDEDAWTRLEKYYALCICGSLAKILK